MLNGRSAVANHREDEVDGREEDQPGEEGRHGHAQQHADHHAGDRSSQSPDERVGQRAHPVARDAGRHRIGLLAREIRCQEHAQEEDDEFDDFHFVLLHSPRGAKGFYLHDR